MTKCSICGKEEYMYSNDGRPTLPIGWSEEWIKDKDGRLFMVEYFCRRCKPSTDNKETNQDISKRIDELLIKEKR